MRLLLANATDLIGITALSRAIPEGRQEIVRLFLAGPRTDTNHCDIRGRTPLVAAYVVGHFGVFVLLLEDPRTEVNVADTDGRTSLHWCAEKAGPWMRTPFLAAVAEQHAEVTRILATDARVDINMNGGSSERPLVVAAEKGLSDPVEMLPQREDADFTSSALKCNASSFENLENSYGASTAKVIMNHLAKIGESSGASSATKCRHP
ncbi:ankyrin [Tuber magnatum]|uniref:Ankyrin n=1 Tax=Tuber magnatum TaxID=42249 RepID=A0A317SUI2_9PEZI|nr:ankyrin [Tuber magnatum]